MKFKIKLRRTLRGNLKAVSPVIATIIIVAIAITMSIAVAYWPLGLGSSFTRYEKVEFTTAYAVPGTAANGGYVITLNLKNTGTAPAAIDPALTLYNAYPASYYTASGFSYASTVNGQVNNAATIVVQPGDSATLTITVPKTMTAGTNAFASGQTLEITLHSTGGKDYPKVVTLP